MKKRLLVLFLLLALASSLACPAFAEARVTSGQCGDHAFWRFDAGSSTLIISGTGAVDMYEYGFNDGNQLISSPWWYFRLNPSIRHIVVEEGITAIRGNAFEMTNFAESISLPSTLQELSGEVFSSGCDECESITVPDSVVRLEGKVFYNSGFQTVRLGKGVRALSEGAFSYASVERLECPSLREIGDGAFSDCYDLKSVDLSRVETIGRGAFYRCESLEEADLRSAKTIGSYAFRQSGVKRVTFCSELSAIEKNTFLNTRLESASINGTAADRDRLAASIAPEGNDSLLALTIQPVSLPPLAPVDAPPAPGPFDDVAADRWSAPAIERLSQAGVVNGYDGRRFLPENDVTRAEFSKMLYLLLPDGFVPTVPKTFRDVTWDAWYVNYVRNLAALGIVNGVGDGYFLPDAPITRQDMAAMITRMLAVYHLSLPERKPPSDFADSGSVADYARTAVSQMQRLGIITGFEDGTFRPEAHATREQTAQMLSNLMNAMGK